MILIQRRLFFYYSPQKYFFQFGEEFQVLEKKLKRKQNSKEIRKNKKKKTKKQIITKNVKEASMPLVKRQL